MRGAGGTTSIRRFIRADEIPVDTPRVPAREAAEDELSKPMYHENDPNLLQRGLNSFWDWLAGLFDAVAGGAPGGPLGIVLVVLIVVGLAVALWWRLGTPQRTVRSADALFGGGTHTADAHRTAAETHAAAGRWTEAIQERMRAVVRDLEERALLDPRPGRTADEAAAKAGRHLPPYAVRLRTAARTFDDVTYGGRTGTEQTYATLLALDLELVAAKPLLTSTVQGAGA
ncbi:DUF4129 domain-containing protein [Streptomyces finlayi]|uniref:DUF4129 domain-containing protein n=1 Tax=Streptomyces finlayi TaxID=67296 RepID=A0A7G7BNT2_9ACTN|nr:DUF4129 domain-containing protein [Streptomyces finlayi]QNE76997.1 DUF4129 domain-containing protein [Streptomyces finlayi]